MISSVITMSILGALCVFLMFFTEREREFYPIPYRVCVAVTVALAGYRFIEHIQTLYVPVPPIEIVLVLSIFGIFGWSKYHLEYKH